MSKLTPSNCKKEKCTWNEIAPGENSQECIGCEGNIRKDWRPKVLKEKVKVRDLFSEPDRNEFCRECIRVGEALEALGYILTGEHYSQGTQFLFYHKGSIWVGLNIDIQET